MHTLPQGYGGEHRLQASEELALCEEECTPKGQHPRDEAGFALCCLLMQEIVLYCSYNFNYSRLHV